MSKESGLGDQLYIHAYDLSGDVGSIQSLLKSYGEQITTGIDKTSVERLLLLGDGEIGFNNYFNPADTPDSLHEVLNDLPDADRLASYFRGSVLGTVTASLVGKQINYSLARNSDGALIGSAISIKANSYPLEFGEAGTDGKHTDVAADEMDGVDGGLRRPAPCTIVSSDINNPTHIITLSPHGRSTGNWVRIAGHTGSVPAVDGDHEITRVNDYEYTVDVNVTTAGTGGTSQPIIAIATSSIADPTHIVTEDAHGFVSGDWVVIEGHSAANPDINKAYIITYVNATEFTIDVNMIDGGTGGSVTRTSTKLGLSAYEHIFAFTGTDVTVKLQHSADDAVTDAYADITDAAFAQASAIGSERIETAADLLIRRWIRVVTTTVGGVNPVTFAVAVCRK